MVRDESVGLITPFTVVGETFNCLVTVFPDSSVTVATTVPPEEGRLKA